MDRVDDAARTAFLTAHPEWSLEGEELTRTFVFGDFVGSMGFVTQVAILAEVADHHPDIDIRWNKVTLGLTTHEAGALTEKDTVLAERISAFI